jgi:hypothetical protein
MKKLLALVIACFTIYELFLWYAGKGGNSFALMAAGMVALVVLNVWATYLESKKMPGGYRGRKLQGTWILEKHFRFDPVLKKYEALPVEEDKNYFEFRLDQFRSGDLDEKGEQIPAEYSPFSIVGDSIIFESEFLKKGNWQFAIKKKKLELAGETVNPAGKSLFIFRKFN